MAGAWPSRVPRAGWPRSRSRERGNRPSAVRIPTLSQSAMTFAPSIFAFGWFGILQKLDGKEKLGRPARARGWDG